MPEAILLLAGLVVAGALVLAPLRRRNAPDTAPPGDEEHDAAALRHRVALEALRDVETDRRAGSLDEASYAAQLAEAEERAASTRAALDVRSGTASAPSHRRGRGAALVAAGVIGAVLLGGALLPPTGIGNRTQVNQELADAQAAEAQRQERISSLLDALAEDQAHPDPDILSALADAYLAGSSREDLVRAAVSLQLLIELEPGRVDAYARIITAYLRAGDAPNARAAHDAFAAGEGADPVEVAFLDGLIALRGENDPGAAVAAFDRFLELAPDDPRAEMIRGLRDGAANGS